MTILRDVLIVLGLFLVLPMALAVDPCYVVTWNGVNIQFGVGGPGTYDNLAGFTVENVCSGSSVAWVDPVNLTLGPLSSTDVIIGDSWIFVDSAARPDLDYNATLVFSKIGFAIEPSVLRDGTTCLPPQCSNATFNPSTGELTVEVAGFSNYSLQGRQEFTVYYDPEPELKNKVYQTIDLGNSHRNEVFSCFVQVFGRNQAGAYVLVQTNPERQSQGKWFGNADPTQPESLGYFPTNGGLANVYFRNDNLAGYQDLEYVAQCSSNSSLLVYEDGLSTRYSPAGRSLVGRGVWLTDGSNAFYVVILIVGAVLLIWVGWSFLRRTFG
jgi:hypothetical protein